MTLGGTNTYVVGSEPAYVIDPGPDDRDHIAAVLAEAKRRGGLGGVVLTHSHADHSAGVAPLGGELLWGHPGQSDEPSALTAALAQPAGDASVPGPSTGSAADPRTRRGGASPATSVDSSVSAAEASSGAAASPSPELRAGPFTVIPTAGHAADHVCFVLGDVGFCGDLILGEGSTIVPPAAGGGSLADYMASLTRIAELDLELLCPGHGPWIGDPAAAIAAYKRHRQARESRLVAALDSGVRSRAKLLDLAWDDVPAELRPAAALAMEAHLEKLEAEDRGPGQLDV